MNDQAKIDPHNAGPRAELLNEAKKIVMKDRNSAYGNPEDNFRDIAMLQAAYMHGKMGPINSMDVAMLNILQKIARLKKNPSHRDSLVDIAGYAACAADIQAAMGQALNQAAAGAVGFGFLGSNGQVRAG